MCTVRRAFFAGWTDLSEGEGALLQTPCGDASGKIQAPASGWERVGEGRRAGVWTHKAGKASGSGSVFMGGQLPPVAAGGIRWLGQGSPLVEIWESHPEKDSCVWAQKVGLSLPREGGSSPGVQSWAAIQGSPGFGQNVLKGTEWLGQPPAHRVSRAKLTSEVSTLKQQLEVPTRPSTPEPGLSGPHHENLGQLPPLTPAMAEVAGLRG